jgi:DNA (cytosine-5)-methyltransferase 1
MFTAIDLFSGCGGLSEGFRQERFKVTAAVEQDKVAAKTYRMNHPETLLLEKNIADVGLMDILPAIKDMNTFSPASLDVLIGSPPCQAFSTAGKQNTEDPRATLFKEYVRILKITNPKMFLFENVEGMKNISKGSRFEEILKELSGAGYNLSYKVLNAKDFGIPQDRKRLFIVGVRKDFSEKLFEFPEGNYPKVTLMEAISDLPEPSFDKVLYTSLPQNEYQGEMRRYSKAGTIDTIPPGHFGVSDHTPTNHNERLLKIMSLLPEGGTIKDLPEGIRPKKCFPNSYARLWGDRPAPTITRNFGTPSSQRCIHPTQPRALTTREGARLQSFNDAYVFCGSRAQKNLQIGNAVPPKLARVLAKAIQKELLCHLDL